MSESPPVQAPAAGPVRSRVAAWVLWDFGATPVNAIVVTFVFSVYLTNAVGDDLPGGASPTSWLGRALAVAGLVVAVFAPVTGVWWMLPGGGAGRWPCSPARWWCSSRR